MVATPKYGQMVFVGLMSGLGYNKDIYLSDVDNAQINFDAGGGAAAGSPNDWLAPEALVLIDYAQVTGTADTEKLQITRNDVPTGNMLRYTIHLTSLNNRPRLSIPFRKGDRISAIQIAD